MPFTPQEIFEQALEQGTVDVPEWGGECTVRAITAHELSRARREATNRRTNEQDPVALAAVICEIGCVDPEFAPGQHKALMRTKYGPIEQVSDKILDLTGLSALGESGAGMEETD